MERMSTKNAKNKTSKTNMDISAGSNSYSMSRYFVGYRLLFHTSFILNYHLVLIGFLG